MVTEASTKPVSPYRRRTSWTSETARAAAIARHAAARTAKATAAPAVERESKTLDASLFAQVERVLDSITQSEVPALFERHILLSSARALDRLYRIVDDDTADNREVLQASAQIAALSGLKRRETATELQPTEVWKQRYLDAGVQPPDHLR
jgi:hypothetical protein